jgi:integrator complex subunit 1
MHLTKRIFEFCVCTIRQLPLLAAVLGGRTQLTIGEMRHRNLLLLFTHVLGLLELLQPQIFHRNHTSLPAILQAYFSLFRVSFGVLILLVLFMY